MKITHPACGRSWGGLRAEHCPACHQTFTGTTAGDRHRRGPQDDRRCIAPADAGLVLNARGLWALPGSFERDDEQDDAEAGAA